MTAAGSFALLLAIGVKGAVPSRPAPTDVVTGQAVTRLAVDEAHVYWTGDAGVFRTPLAGGAASKLWDRHAAALAVDAQTLYVGAQDGVWALPKKGGAPVLLVAADRVSALALDGEFVVFGHGNAPPTVIRVPKGGGAPQTLAAVSGIGIGSVAVDQGSVYFVLQRPRFGEGAVMKIEKAGGTPVTLYEGNVGSGLAVDETYVYFSAEGPNVSGIPGGSLARVGKTGAGPAAPLRRPAPERIAVRLEGPRDLVRRDRFLYAVVIGSIVPGARRGGVVRVPAEGGWVETLADGQGGAIEIAMGADRVFWAATLDRAVRSLPLPGPQPEPPRGCAGATIDLDAAGADQRCADARSGLPAPAGLVVRIDPPRVTLSPGKSVDVRVVIESTTDQTASFKWSRAPDVEIRDRAGKTRVDVVYREDCGFGYGVGHGSSPARFELAPHGRATTHVTVKAVATHYDCDLNPTTTPLKPGTYTLHVKTTLDLAADGVLVVR